MGVTGMRGNAGHVRGGRAKPRHRRPMRRAAALLTTALSSAGVLAVAVLGVSRSGLVAGARLDASALKVRAYAGQLARPGPGGASFTRVAWSAGKGGMGSGSENSWGSENSGGSVDSGALSLTRADREACPATATACVDLNGRLTWLQSGGDVTYGPVRMEPGALGSPNATPRGTFRVRWKAGPRYVSRQYGDPMPWATFFAPGGVAFHGGSLARTSHGCVHLTPASARYFQAHLPVGAEVVVF